MSDTEYVNPEHGNDTPPVDYSQGAQHPDGAGPQSVWREPGPAVPPTVPPMPPQGPLVYPAPFPGPQEPFNQGHSWTTNGVNTSMPPAPQEKGFLEKRLGTGMELFLGVFSIILSGIATVPVVFVLLVRMHEEGMIDLFTSETALTRTRYMARLAEVVLIVLGLVGMLFFVLVGLAS